MPSLLRRVIYCTHAIKIVRTSSSKSAKDGESPLLRLLQDATSFGEVGASVAGKGELRWATQPYAVGPPDATQPDVSPTDATVLLFPGQGSQFVGMGRRLMDVPSARDLYKLASEIVGWDVGRLCLEGPETELERRCQTAVLVTSLAALEAARDSRPAAVERAVAAAGFSLGEFAALVFSGALPLDGALRLVELRAAAMSAAAAARAGGMLTVWLAADARLAPLLRAARDHARPDAVCEVANYLFPGCKVLAGDEEALRYVEREGRKFGVRRAARVRVAGAYHTALMARAAEAVREGVALVTVSEPRVRVVSCLDGRAHGGSADVRRRLVRLTTSPVRWEQVLHALYARPRPSPQPLTLALGPGTALRSTLKMVNARAWDASVQIDT